MRRGRAALIVGLAVLTIWIWHPSFLFSTGYPEWQEEVDLANEHLGDGGGGGVKYLRFDTPMGTGE